MNLQETLIGQVGPTTKFVASTGDFPFPNIVRDLDYSDGVSCIMILRPSKEILAYHLQLGKDRSLPCPYKLLFGLSVPLDGINPLTPDDL
jgi:hypothetical protein